jgi:hypothetical protein
MIPHLSGSVGNKYEIIVARTPRKEKLQVEVFQGKVLSLRLFNGIC